MFGNKRGPKVINEYNYSSQNTTQKIPKYDPATYSSSSEEYSEELVKSTRSSSEITKLKQKNKDLIEKNKNISLKCDELHKTISMLQTLLNNNNEINTINSELRGFDKRLGVLESKMTFNDNVVINSSPNITNSNLPQINLKK